MRNKFLSFLSITFLFILCNSLKAQKIGFSANGGEKSKYNDKIGPLGVSGDQIFFYKAVNGSRTYESRKFVFSRYGEFLNKNYERKLKFKVSRKIIYSKIIGKEICMLTTHQYNSEDSLQLWLDKISTEDLNLISSKKIGTVYNPNNVRTKILLEIEGGGVVLIQKLNSFRDLKTEFSVIAINNEFEIEKTHNIKLDLHPRDGVFLFPNLISNQWIFQSVLSDENKNEHSAMLINIQTGKMIEDLIHDSITVGALIAQGKDDRLNEYLIKEKSDNSFQLIMNEWDKDFSKVLSSQALEFPDSMKLAKPPKERDKIGPQFHEITFGKIKDSDSLRFSISQVNDANGKTIIVQSFKTFLIKYSKQVPGYSEPSWGTEWIRNYNNIALYRFDSNNQLLWTSVIPISILEFKMGRPSWEDPITSYYLMHKDNNLYFVFGPREIKAVASVNQSTGETNVFDDFLDEYSKWIFYRNQALLDHENMNVYVGQHKNYNNRIAKILIQTDKGE